MIRSSLAPSSHAWYSRCWHLYLDFIAPSAPVPPVSSRINAFLASLTEHSPLARAIHNVVAALKHRFAVHDIAWEPSPLTVLLIRGIAKSTPPPVSRPRDPFLPSHLLALSRLLDLSNPLHLHMLTACALALFLALRPSELSSLRRSNLSSLSRSDFTISFARSKSRHSARSDSRSIRSPFLVLLLQRYLALPRSGSSDQLFDLPDARSVNTLALQVGALIEAPLLRGHSFRIGAAVCF